MDIVSFQFPYITQYIWGHLKCIERLSGSPNNNECVAYVLPLSAKTKTTYTTPLNTFFCCHMHYVFGAVCTLFLSNIFQQLVCSRCKK